MSFFKNLFRKNSTDSKPYSKDEIKAIAKNFQNELPAKLAALNAIKPYTPQTVIFNSSQVKYLAGNEKSIEEEIEQTINLMKELSRIGLIDVEDESVAYTEISNLDFYFESWQIMKFRNFNGKTPVGTHIFGIGQVFGKGMIEKYPNLTWQYSAHNKSDGNLILIDLKNDIELNPLKSLMRCKNRNERAPFEALEKKYLELLNSVEDYDRIAII